MNPEELSIMDGFNSSLNEQTKSFIKLISGGFTHELNISMKVEKFHSHNFFEVHFVVDGEIDYLIEGRKVTLPVNHFLVVPPGTKHEVIKYSPGILKLSMCFDVDDLMYKQALINSDSMYEIDRNITNDINFIIEQIETKNAFRVVILNRMLEILYFAISHIMDIYKNNLKTDTMDKRLLKAKEYILYNRRRFLNCNEVADYCEISEKQLTRLFQKYEGMSASEFIYHQKIYDIKKIIRNSKLPLNEIAKRLGFSSASYFMRFFKKHTGMTPNEYRKKHAEDYDFDIIEL